MIQPLGEQIIIRAIPTDSIGSIIVPDSAKSITQKGSDGNVVNFVEAEVIAVGPGKRGKGDSTILSDMVTLLRARIDDDEEARKDPHYCVKTMEFYHEAKMCIQRAEAHSRVPLTVKPGDRILYHPAVQRFDRKVEGLGEGEFYIIREESVLAILEPEG